MLAAAAELSASQEDSCDSSDSNWMTEAWGWLKFVKSRVDPGERFGMGERRYQFEH